LLLSPVLGYPLFPQYLGHRNTPLSSQYHCPYPTERFFPADFSVLVSLDTFSWNISRVLFPQGHQGLRPPFHEFSLKNTSISPVAHIGSRAREKENSGGDPFSRPFLSYAGGVVFYLAFGWFPPPPSQPPMLPSLFITNAFSHPPKYDSFPCLFQCLLWHGGSPHLARPRFRLLTSLNVLGLAEEAFSLSFSLTFSPPFLPHTTSPSTTSLSP